MAPSSPRRAAAPAAAALAPLLALLAAAAPAARAASGCRVQGTLSRSRLPLARGRGPLQPLLQGGLELGGERLQWRPSTAVPHFDQRTAQGSLPSQTRLD